MRPLNALGLALLLTAGAAASTSDLGCKWLCRTSGRDSGAFSSEDLDRGLLWCDCHDLVPFPVLDGNKRIVIRTKKVKRPHPVPTVDARDYMPAITPDPDAPTAW